MTTVVTVFDADTVTACLTRVAAAVTDAADSLIDVVPLPARQLLLSAGATWDCEMLYTSIISVQTGLPESAGETGGNIFSTGAYTYPQGMTVWTVTVEAGIVRRVTTNPGGTRGTVAPSPDQYAADMTAISSDTAVLVNAAMTLGSANLQPVPHTGNALRADGGMHGTAFTLTVEAFPGPPLP